MINRSLTGQTYHCYQCPERSMPADALAVHGLTAEFLADKPLFADVAGKLLAFVGDAPLFLSPNSGRIVCTITARNLRVRHVDLV
jgi:DNA polymerase-3 subunit epsilon